MSNRKNELMLWITLIAVILTLPFHLMHRVWDIMNHIGSHGIGTSGPSYSMEYSVELNILFAVPFILWFTCLVVYRLQRDHRSIPVLNTIILTFSSISMIAGGGGQNELHFSIFMVIAIVSYYESIALVLLMATIFAIQHLAGYWLNPMIVFGSDQYSFFMVLIHAFFLLLTSGATIWQMKSTLHIKKELFKRQEEEKKLFYEDIVSRLAQTSSQVIHISELLTAHADRTLEFSKQNAASVQEIASGMERPTLRG